ncbi:hypothetical protein BH23BAC3_BH23BAC3_07200 [soil metagenome]
MKKLLAIIFATALLIGTSSFISNAHAQVETTNQGSVQEGDFKAGIGLVFGTGIGFGSLDNDLGIRADGYYAFTDVIRGGGDFTFYFPKSEGPAEITVWELNLNGHYIFMDEDDLILYGLGGINITGFSFESTFSFAGITETGSSSDTEFGLNLGGGVEYALDFADLFAEAKLGGLGGNANQFVLGAGLRFSF